MVAYANRLDGMKDRLESASKAFKKYKKKDKDPDGSGMYASYTAAKAEIDGLKERIAKEEAKIAAKPSKSKTGKTSQSTPVSKASNAAAAREAQKGFSAEKTKGKSNKTGMTDAESTFAGFLLGGGVGGAAFKAFMKIAGMNKVYDWFTTSGKKPTVAAVKDKIQKEVPKNSQDKLPTKFKPTKLDKKEAVVVPKKEAKPPQLRKPEKKPGKALVPVKPKLPAKPGTSVVPKAKRPPQGAPQMLKSEPVPVKAPKRLPPPPPSSKPTNPALLAAAASAVGTATPASSEEVGADEREVVGSGIEGILSRTDQMGGEAPRAKKKKELIAEASFGRMLGLRRSKKEIERDVAITKALDAGNYDKVAELEKQYGKAPVEKSLTQRTKDYTPEQIEQMLAPEVSGSPIKDLKELLSGIGTKNTSSNPRDKYKHGGTVKAKKKKAKTVKVSKVYSNQTRKPSRA